MELLSRVAVEMIDIESVEAPVEVWRKWGSGVILTDDMNGSEDEGERDEAEPE